MINDTGVTEPAAPREEVTGFYGERRLDIALLHSAPLPIEQLSDFIFRPSSMNATAATITVI
jgi:hypothetical protein